MDPITIYPTTLSRTDCRLKFHWAKLYKPKRRAVHYDFGIAIHHALEQYYTEKADPVKAFEAYWDTEMLTLEGMDDKDRALGVAMLKNYVKFYTSDREDFTVFYTEKEIARRIPIPKDDPNPPAIAKRFYVAARVDAIVWDRKLAKKFVLEHKTFETFYPGSLNLDHQFVIEAFVANGITQDPVEGVIYNGLRKKAEGSGTTKLFERHYLYINERQIKVALHRAYWTLRTVTDPNFVVYPEPGTLKCNMCEFKNPCAEYMRGGDYQFQLDNSYDSREESEEEEQWV